MAYFLTVIRTGGDAEICERKFDTLEDALALVSAEFVGPPLSAVRLNAHACIRDGKVARIRMSASTAGREWPEAAVSGMRADIDHIEILDDIARMDLEDYRKGDSTAH